MKRIISLILAALMLLASSGAYAAKFDIDEYARDIPDPMRDIIYVSGTWEEMGRQYATQQEASIRRTIVRAVSRAVDSHGSVDAYVQANQASLDTYKEKLPQAIDLFNGIASAGEFSFNEIFCAFGALAMGDFCNAATAWGEATGGSVVSGINSDRDTVEYNDPTIIFFPDDPAYPECVYPTIAWRGLESNGAFNSAGLFQALTGGQSHQEGDVAPGGMSAHLTKIILTTMCATADEALTKLVDEGRLPTSGTCHIAIDGQGKGWVIEQTAQECVIREQNRSVEGEGDYQIINNIFFDEEMLEHNVTDGSYDDCYPRFETVKYFLDRDYGNVTVDTLRAAMASNTYVDPETKEMSEEPYWGNDGKVYNSPEGVAAKFKTIGRMICNNTDKVAYIISGTENTEISQLPRATGTYNRIALKEDPKAMTQDAQNYAQLYIYQAARDIDNAGTVDAQRRENFELAREYFVEGINYRTLIGYISDPDEVLELYGKATSAFCRAQVYAKTTWDQPQSLASDFDNVGYIY